MTARTMERNKRKIVSIVLSSMESYFRSDSQKVVKSEPVPINALRSLIVC